MSIHDAAAIVRRLGPCRIALDLVAHARLAQELALLGCQPQGHTAGAINPGNGAAYVQWPRAGAGAAETLAEAIRPYAGASVLALQSVGRSRDAIEPDLFAQGWIRHPGGMTHYDYPQWSGRAMPSLTFYCRAEAGSPEGLLASGGADADAAIARYALAASHVRPGDAVLVDGAYAADGARIVGTLSQAGSVRAGLPLDAIAARSLDSVVAFQPATPGGWQARLDDYLRVLKCDGRLILAIRRADADDASLPGSWAVLNEALSSRFLVECRYEQLPLTRDPMGARHIIPAPLDGEADGPWLLAVVSANPLAGASDTAAYVHPAFAGGAASLPALADFGAYDNPWLYRTMVQMGERLGNEDTLCRLAEYVIGNARLGSADQGAALTVYGYRALEARERGAVPGLLEAIQGYAIAAGENPPAHVARWKISLSFLAGRLCEMAGDHAGALRWYDATAAADWQAFAPILATKSVAAAFYAARLHIAGGDHGAARRAFQQGMDIALRAAGSAHGDHMGDPDRPIPFYLTELAEVIDMGSQCASALARFHLLERDPGLFWQQVDVRRFGLAAWNIDLERENRQLRAAQG
ncbi:hypothetical protein WBP06_12795 [Novosphingobium sp. BL-8H]|uniref:hypothetical protein n=1 Tax=Novosphingobium sp. BL-8H TaxID=3127640 RepID=UPI003756ADF6